jgi:hypothetical protein
VPAHLRRRPCFELGSQFAQYRGELAAALPKNTNNARRAFAWTSARTLS